VRSSRLFFLRSEGEPARMWSERLGSPLAAVRMNQSMGQYRRTALQADAQKSSPPEEKYRAADKDPPILIWALLISLRPARAAHGPELHGLAAA
jgi:hypothetical protein